MDTVKTIKEVRQKVREWRADSLTIGLSLPWDFCTKVTEA